MARGSSVYDLGLPGRPNNSVPDPGRRGQPDGDRGQRGSGGCSDTRYRSSSRSGIRYPFRTGDGGSPYDKLSENDTVVFFDTGEIPFDIIDAAIALPSTILDFIPLDVQSETILFFVFLLFRVSLIHILVEYFYHLSSIL